MGLAGAAAAAGVAVSAGTAIAGGVGGSKNSGGSTQTSTTSPLQQEYYQNAFTNAQAIMDQRNAAPLPTSYFADTNQMQTDANQQLYNQGMGGQAAMAGATAAGNGLLGNYGAYSANANALASNGLGGQLDPAVSSMLQNYALTGQMPYGGVDQQLSGNLTNAATTGLGSVGSAQSIANQVAGRQSPSAAMNATVDGASQFLNNGVLNGQIDALGTDISRNLYQTTLPGIQQAAAASGNVNSSREGALEAIAGSQAQENLLNAASNIRASAYNTGANLASGDYQNAQSNALGAASALNTNGSTAGNLATGQLGLQQAGVNAQLSAGNSLNSSNLAYQLGNAQTQLSANSQLGSGITTGLNAVNTGYTDALQGSLAAQSAGTYQQAQDQQAINNANALWSANDNRSQNLLTAYLGDISGNAGSTTMATATPQNGNALTGALGGLTQGIGMAKNWGAFDNLGSLFAPSPKPTQVSTPTIQSYYDYWNSGFPSLSSSSP